MVVIDNELETRGFVHTSPNELGTDAAMHDVENRRRNQPLYGFVFPVTDLR